MSIKGSGKPNAGGKPLLGVAGKAHLKQKTRRNVAKIRGRVNRFLTEMPCQTAGISGDHEG